MITIVWTACAVTAAAASVASLALGIASWRREAQRGE